MSDAIQVEFSWTDYSRLRAQMERASRELGKSLGQSLKWAAHSLAVTLGAQTKVAKKFRVIRPIKSDKKDWGREKEAAAGRREFEVADWRFNPRPKLYRVWAANVAAVKKLPRAIVKNAGMAKMAWMWNIRKLGRSEGSMAGVTDQAKRKGERYAEVQSNLKGDDPFVIMKSRLPYASSALMNGAASLQTAMRNAAGHMMHQIDGNIQKKMKAA